MRASSAVMPAAASTRCSTTSARPIASRVRAMPIISTSSALSPNPAVSMMLSGMPSIKIAFSMRSRVVPGTAVTMAASSPASALSSDDLPTLGRPASTTFNPARRRAPWVARPRMAPRAALRASIRAQACSHWRKSISSSGKSSVASTSMRSVTSSSRSACTSRENAPSSERTAARAACADAASIRSATLSACAKSSLSLR